MVLKARINELAPCGVFYAEQPLHLTAGELLCSSSFLDALIRPLSEGPFP
jgi:hypothetical protein